jgi:hypothetical protein
MDDVGRLTEMVLSIARDPDLEAAQSGTNIRVGPWVPAFAGMTDG